MHGRYPTRLQKVQWAKWVIELFPHLKWKDANYPYVSGFQSRWAETCIAKNIEVVFQSLIYRPSTTATVNGKKIELSQRGLLEKRLKTLRRGLIRGDAKERSKFYCWILRAFRLRIIFDRVFL